MSAPSVWSFFASYRADVRAKVAALRAGQQAGTPEADASLAEARRYLALAQAIAHPPAPRLVITHGLSGSGKSWASGRWLQAEASGRAVRLRSDVERKRLHGVSPLAASGSGLNAGLYRPQAHEQTYASLRTRTRGLLQDGWTVVVDAAFLRAAERRAFAELAQAEGCPFHILACEAPTDVLRQRIAARQAAGGDASEATLAVLEQQLGWLEPLTDAERASAMTSVQPPRAAGACMPRPPRRQRPLASSPSWPRLRRAWRKRTTHAGAAPSRWRADTGSGDAIRQVGRRHDLVADRFALEEAQAVA